MIDKEKQLQLVKEAREAVIKACEHADIYERLELIAAITQDVSNRVWLDWKPND